MALAMTRDPANILADLRSRNEESRLRASSELAAWVATRGNTVDAHARSIQELAPRLTALINSNDLTDKLAGLNAIDTLLEATQDPSIAARLATQPWLAIPSVDPLIMAHAAKTYARLVARGGALVKNVELQVQTASEWLQDDRNESRRYAAALVFRELARTAPFSVADRVDTILDYLWTALRDPKVNIREAAASALSGCLKIAASRDAATRNECFAMVFEQAQKGFKSNNGDAIHGSLLGYKELFTNGNMFMQERYNEVCEQVLSYRDHRENLVRRAVIELIPTLASYNHQEFIGSYLHRCMIYLLGQLKKERDRTTSFHAIGHVALAVTNSMSPYLDPVLASIKEGLSARGRKNAPSEMAIFQCISMLATAVGQALTKHMHELLDLMFAYGLSEPLVRALTDLATNIPPLLQTIQERLLNLLCLLLGGELFKTPGAPLSTRPPASSITRDLSTLNTTQEPHDVPTITLALDTLGSFDFSGILLHELVRDTVTNYLDHDSRDVRMAAAQTCCRLFARDPIIFQTSNYSINLVTEVLEKLLVCAIADPDPHIRQSTLAALDTKFDRHLAQAENVRSIFLAVNDEVYSIREIAIKIIGRISVHNPAYVMPSLRKALIQLLTELEYSTYSSNREECATLLGLLVGASARLSKPYVLSILRVLLPKARDVNPGVASAIMLALGELARVGGEDVLPRLDEYMSLIIEMLHDQASLLKRDAALHTLGLLSSHSGYVIEPYLKYPTLLGTLITILKTENVPATRRETVKVMGILGALDPYKQVVQQSAEENVDLPLNATDPSHPMNIGPSHDEYYPTVAFHALLSILRDTSLANHHTAVVEAVMYIFNSLRLRCVTFLPQVIPAFLGAMRTVQQGSMQEKYYFENLSKLIKVVGPHIRNHLTPILALIRDSWTSGPALQVILVDLVEKIAVALEGEFKVYLPTLLPLMLTSFDADFGERRLPSLQRILHAFGIFGANLEEYLHLVIPVIVRTFERSEPPLPLRRHAVQVMGVLCRKINFSDHASRVIHPLSRVLSYGPPELRNDTMDALCSLVSQIGSDFAIFVPMINKCLIQNRIQHNNYDQLVTKLLRGEPLPNLAFIDNVTGPVTELDPAADAGVNKLPVNQQQLKTQWETTDRAKADDWRDWMKRLSVALLKASPSLSLRACSGLAEMYHPLARDLFNAAFVSCWTELYESYQDELVRAIDTAFASPTIPPEITQTLLNLAEFMEHDDKSLPIMPRELGSYAQKCHAFAKALHYKELEWTAEPSADTIEALIRINNQLQQPDVAVGILNHAQHARGIELKEDWYEKLQRWDDALAAYERKQVEDPSNFDLKHGRMRCLHALGEWESLSTLARENWRSASSEQRRRIAPLAAAAAWGLAQWEAMDDYIAVLKHDSPDRAWFRAILSIHRNQFGKAQAHVSKARDLLDTELTTLVGESYNRAYNQIVRVQMLAELEEIIQYKESGDNRERRVVIQKTWMKRLRGCQRDVEVWQRILKVRALVVSPRENMEMWIKFANLCRKSGRLGLAEKTLNSLFGEEADFESTAMQGPPHVIYAHLKYMWATGAREETLAYLRDFTGRLTQDLGLNPQSDEPNAAAELAASGQLQEYTHLLARCYYKLGEWQSMLQPDWGSEYVNDILTSYLFATNLDRRWYKAWHSWALANSEVVAYYTQGAQQQGSQEPVPPEIFSGHIVPAVRAFFQSIALSPGNSLQDTLRLLTLWFKYGYHPEVGAAISEGFGSVSVDIWLDVIPQLIARIHATSTPVRKLIHAVLADVGKAHPQALVYPLTVAAKYPSLPRRRAALAIMDRMSEHSAKLVDQARLVSQELIRVAILWHEMWHEGLEEASRLYYGDGNIEAMFATLDPLHDMLEKGPETLREIAFQQSFGRDLQDARESCRRFQAYNEVSDLNQAWDLYYQIFKRIARLLPSFSVLELQQVSPRLLEVHDLELAVPGTYQVGKPIIRIIKFAESFDVLTSKQRPRKLKVDGSDGKDHPFLLKGHEDLRQDERVMQLFGLVNTLLQKDAETFKRHLTILGYPIIPLAPNSGLIGWVDNTDTLHVLVKNYRDSRKILLNIEHRIMLQMAPDYDHMALMQKIEVFEYALDNTTGQDLYRVLWLKSRNSEAWLDRRTNYTRTLATMSMVGHILGLGDRHPSNLLLDRLGGAVVHVDFGDCFEVAMVRDKYPERVPFRLTRMLVQAMEVSGIEGTFRITCENSMRVLRDNKESITAVLEAFVHDPLINWRLIHTSRRGGAAGEGAAGAAAVPGAGGQRTSGGGAGAGGTNRRGGVDETHPGDEEANEALNQRALQVIDRVQQKLTGRDFKPTQVLDVKEQVQRLILQATSVENLCQTFIGWCAFW